MLEPGIIASGSCDSTLLPFIQSLVPIVSSRRMVRNSTCDTAAIDASASPLNPIVESANRSDAELILDVEWRSKARRASVSLIPHPLSMTWMRVRPASLSTTFIWSAPASTEFSTSSFTTEAGRCITSPAAIWLATESGRSFMTSFIVNVKLVNCTDRYNHV